ncbi:MAG: response regulator [Candidatus Delongbacteria bacterium]|nr:response regulator [Candidatus Delongbacteria bacterium]MBN2835352.1 response regulator [Candidatus Delongbacteria bacterium]
MSNILWIDDEIVLLQPFVMYLEKKNYKIFTATNGKDGLEIISNEEIDLVLLDEMMIGMDGLTVLHKIKEIDDELPVIMITKSEEENIFLEAIGSKISDYITKPVNPVQIHLSIKKILERSDIIRAKFSRDYPKEFEYLGEALEKENVNDVNFWFELNERICKKELELDEFGNENLKNSHKLIKNEYNIQFSKFLVSNYKDWIFGNRNFLLSNDLLKKLVLPEVNNNKKTAFFVLDSIRFDQMMMIEAFLNKRFKTEISSYIGLIPSTTVFARNSIFSGFLPIELEERYEGFFDNLFDNGSSLNDREKELIFDFFKRHGLTSKKISYNKIFSQTESVKIEKSIRNFFIYDASFFAYDIFDFLLHSKTTTNLLDEIMQDDKSFRKFISEWFSTSSLYRIMESLLNEGVKLIITTDHGNIRTEKFTDVSADEIFSTGTRFRFGRNIRTSNKKQSWQIQVADQIGLPRSLRGKNLVISKENYAFINEKSFNDFKLKIKNSFQHGGISMEENILPILKVWR